MTENVARPGKEVIASFLDLSTPTVSDALDKLGLRGGCEGIRPVVAQKKIVGPALTLKYEPVGTNKGTVGDYLEYARPGDVIVIDNGGRTYCTVWGDLLTISASKMGIAGTVIDGVCRDVPRILDVGYPIFTRGVFMVTGKDRVQLEAINVPVSISNVRVHPGDLVIGDDSGVVIVPNDKLAQVLEVAQAISEAEDAIERDILEGVPLTEARKRHGYHRLQRRN